MAYEDPYRNYLRLKDTVLYLQAGGHVSEDWMFKHMAHIIKYKEIFEKMSDVNVENEDCEFRKLADETEVILDKLIISIVNNSWFDINQYLLLNINMIRMCDILQEEYDLETCIEMLSI